MSEADLEITLRTTRPRGLLGSLLQQAAAKPECALRARPCAPPAWGTGQRNGGASPREGSPRCSRHGSQTGETAAPAGRACHAAGFECPVVRGARELRTPQRARRASEECGVPGAVRWAALYQAASGPVRAREFGVGPWDRHAGCSVCSATVRDRRVVSGVWRVPTVPRVPRPRVSASRIDACFLGPGADVGRQLIEGAGSLGSRRGRATSPPACLRRRGLRSCVTLVLRALAPELQTW